MLGIVTMEKLNIYYINFPYVTVPPTLAILFSSLCVILLPLLIGIL